MKKYIATFYSHFGAIRFSRELKGKSIEGVIMPVPRNLSSSCGTCVSYQSDNWEVCEIHGEVEQVVEVVSDGYDVLYRAENS